MMRAKFLGRMRLPLLSLLAATFALLISHFGWMARLETALADHFAFAEPVKPSGHIVLVEINKQVIESTGRYPIDRSLLAETLGRVEAGGARRIYIDIQMSTVETPEADQALEMRLKSLGPQRVGLPISIVPMPDGGNIRMQPHERFARYGRLAPSEPLFDADRRARRMRGDIPDLGPAASDWLVYGDTARRGAPLPIDFSINPGSLPRFSLLDVIAGKVPADVFRDKLVVIGVTTSNPMSVVNVPVYERLSRVETIALAAETLLVGKQPRVLTLAERWGLVFLSTFVLCVLIRTTGAAVSLLLVAGGSAAWFWWVGALQHVLNVSLPLTAPPLAAIIAWQMLKLRDSRLAHALQKLYTRLFGVGQNALVMAVEVIGDPAFVVDAQGDVVGANERFAALVTAAFPERKSPLQMPVATIFPGPLMPSHDPLAGSAISHADLTLTEADGSTRYFDASLRSMRTVAGPVTIASLKDVTEVRNREAELTNLAFRDALTGLSNRVAFHARLNAQGNDPARHVAIHLIDLDGFKKVNDTLGHHAGDVLLAGVGARLTRLVRPEDMVARLGGDEFAILQVGVGAEGAETLAARIIAALSQPFDLEGAPARIGASIGIALCPDHHADANEALKLADAAMYVAKRNKPAYAIHTPGGARLVA